MTTVPRGSRTVTPVTARLGPPLAHATLASSTLTLKPLPNCLSSERATVSVRRAKESGP